MRAHHEQVRASTPRATLQARGNVLTDALRFDQFDITIHPELSETLLHFVKDAPGIVAQRVDHGARIVFAGVRKCGGVIQHI
jgi:hypothetical protein